MTTTQQVEAGWVSGRMTISLDPVGVAVARAEADGTAAGRRALDTALAAAVGPTLRRAAELLAVIQAATEQQAGHQGRLAALDRRAASSAGLLFGVALDKRLNDLDRERVVEVAEYAAAGRRRAGALDELRAVRDDVTSDGPAVVANAVNDRRTTATAEREQAAHRLAAVVAEPLARLLALDAELIALNKVAAADAVKDELEDSLPAVFAESGLTPHTAYDWRTERAEREAEQQRRGMVWNDIVHLTPTWNDRREEDD